MVNAVKLLLSYMLLSDIVREQTGQDPMEVFEQAIGNIMPLLEVKARRGGGSNYQVPVEVRPERRYTLAIR